MSNWTQLSPEQFKAHIRALLASVLDMETEDIPTDKPLVESLGIDSVMLMQILVVLRRTFGVDFEDSDLLKLQPATIEDIHAILLQKMAAQQ